MATYILRMAVAWALRPRRMQRQVQGANLQKFGDIVRHHWRGLHILTLTRLTDLPLLLSDRSLHLRAWEARQNHVGSFWTHNGAPKDGG